MSVFLLHSTIFSPVAFSKSFVLCSTKFTLKMMKDQEFFSRNPSNFPNPLFPVVAIPPLPPGNLYMDPLLNQPQIQPLSLTNALLIVLFSLGTPPNPREFGFSTVFSRALVETPARIDGGRKRGSSENHHQLRVLSRVSSFHSFHSPFPTS